MTMIYSGLPLNNNKSYRICWILNQVLSKDRVYKVQHWTWTAFVKNVQRHSFPSGPGNWSSWECIRSFYFLLQRKTTDTSINIKCINEKKKITCFVTVIKNVLDLGGFFILQLTVRMRVVHSPWEILCYKLHRGSSRASHKKCSGNSDMWECSQAKRSRSLA